MSLCQALFDSFKNRPADPYIPRYVHGLDLLEYDSCLKLGWYGRKPRGPVGDYAVLSSPESIVLDLSRFFEATDNDSRCRAWIDLEDQAKQALERERSRPR